MLDVTPDLEVDLSVYYLLVVIYCQWQFVATQMLTAIYSTI
jgi:hypothetical protein